MLTETRATGIIAPMTGYASGRATRRAILLALLAREPQSMEDLARASGTSQPNVSKALRGMERDGVVTVVRRTGRAGAEVRLTPTARIVMEIATLP